MPRLSAGQILFLVFLVFAFLYWQDPRIFRFPGRLQATLIELALVLAAILLAITVHEFSHALVAVALGDPTPKLMGRLSLNPLRHLDPLGTLLILVARFGWGKPVVFNPNNLKGNPRLGSAAVSFAGPLANILIAMLLAAAVERSTGRLDPTVAGFVLGLREINILLAAFNLVPIPPLDGFGVVQGLLPARLSYALEPLRQYGPIILLVAVFAPRLGGPDLIGPIMRPIIGAIRALVGSA
jgi:Zn-dependent protease